MDPLTTGAFSSGLDALIALALDKWTFAIIAGVYFALRSMTKIFASVPLWYRVLPFLPDLLGVTASVCHLVPAASEQPVLVRAAIGLWIGYVAQRFHKILGQTVLGDDDAITDLVYRRRSAPPPQPPASPGG